MASLLMRVNFPAGWTRRRSEYVSVSFPHRFISLSLFDSPQTQGVTGVEVYLYMCLLKILLHFSNTQHKGNTSPLDTCPLLCPQNVKHCCTMPTLSHLYSMDRMGEGSPLLLPLLSSERWMPQNPQYVPDPLTQYSYNNRVIFQEWKLELNVMKQFRGTLICSHLSKQKGFSLINMISGQ